MAPEPPRLGGVLATLDTLGPAPRSNWSHPPLPGNDFLTRHVEDLTVLAGCGIRSVRLSIDWSRMQPEPGQIDDDWREWYQGVLVTARSLGISTWLTLVESAVPAWFDDEGSFADERAAGLLWPRWVEHAAEIFGDLAAGWFPMIDPVGLASRWAHDTRKHETALVNLAVAWRDVWRILHGGPPVATALGLHLVRAADQTVPAQQRARFDDHVRWRMWLRALRDGVITLPNGTQRAIPDLAGSLDRLGIVTVLDLPEQRVTDDSLRRWGERLGTIVRRAAEEGPDRPLDLGGIQIPWAHAAERTHLVEATVDGLHAAVRDGVPLEQVFVEPAIAARNSSAAALLDRDRQASEDLTAWQQLARGSTTPS